MKTAGRKAPSTVDAEKALGTFIAAIARAKPLPEGGRGKLIIRSVAAKQRPRRKPAR